MGRVPTRTMGARIILLWNPSLPSEVAMMLPSTNPDDEKSHFTHNHWPECLTTNLLKWTMSFDTGTD